MNFKRLNDGIGWMIYCNTSFEMDCLNHLIEGLDAFVNPISDRFKEFITKEYALTETKYENPNHPTS